MANTLVETELTIAVDKTLRQHPEVGIITTAERLWKPLGPNWSYYFICGPRRPISPNEISTLNNLLLEVTRALLQYEHVQHLNLPYEGHLVFGSFIYPEEIPIQANTVVTYQVVSSTDRGRVIPLPQATQLSQEPVLVRRDVIVELFPNADLADYIGSYLDGVFAGSVVEDPAITALSRRLSKEQVETLAANRPLDLPAFRKPTFS